MIRRPPRSTLFPTRRSSDLDVVEAVILFVRLLAAPAVAVELGVLTLHKGALQLGFRLEHRLGDRKSTRLNSSHGYISYAVFCLKKKNYNIRSPILIHH